MIEEIELTEAERIAKNITFTLFNEGFKNPCDDEETIKDFSTPTWYNEELYKRGQEFYKTQRMGFLLSIYYGFFISLIDPRGISILQATGKATDPVTARKRYLTVLDHIITWFENDFSPGSKTLKSVKRIRRLHYVMTKMLEKKGKPTITQFEMSVVSFSVIGFALLRPQLLGIRFKDDEEKKALVHFLAVINHMLGVQERFNLCLLPLDALLVELQIIVRYFLLPLVQIESQDFRDLIKNYTYAFKQYFHEADFEVDIFAVKRLLVVPGYQYKVDLSKETHCRSIFTQSEVDQLNELLHYPTPITVDIPIIEIVKKQVNKCGGNAVEHRNGDIIDGFIRSATNEMTLGPDEEVAIKLINYEKEWPNCLNDLKFQKLSIKAKSVTRWKNLFQKIYKNSIGRFVIETVAGIALYIIKIVGTK